MPRLPPSPYGSGAASPLGMKNPKPGYNSRPMTKKLTLSVLLQAVLIFTVVASAQQPATTPPVAPAPVFRGPFTERFTLDNSRSFEANFDKVH